MNTRTFQSTENRKQSNLSKSTIKNSANKSAFKIADNRTETVTQYKLHKMANNQMQQQNAVELHSVSNNHIKKAIQKKDIEEEELLQGKFKTVQRRDMEEEEPLQGKLMTVQNQGEKKPILQRKGSLNMNDDAGLEKEADVMGVKALTNGQKILIGSDENSTSGLVAHDLSQSVQNTNHTIQRVLTDPANSGLNASLVRQYHGAEDNGDGQSINSNSVAVHEQAITYYKEAKRLRKRAGKLHQDQDGGHLTAIATLDVKIRTRQAKIHDLKPSEKKERATVAKDSGVRRPDYSVVIGTSNQASWITGVSAWQSRNTGT